MWGWGEKGVGERVGEIGGEGEKGWGWEIRGLSWRWEEEKVRG